ncbi:cystathionine gamma-synthase [bacterium]|nr:MAG: cystathionine gamma-synthase [bacterium]RKZ17089.1 MAG: cystathionine gamma-synthase [bacterium]
MGFGTDCVHAGQQPEPRTGAVMTPVFQTSTYRQNAIGDHTGYEYARTQNPTREALEANVAALEGAAHGISFGSGLATISALAQTLSAGDEIVCTENVYGGTYRVFDQVFKRHGLGFHFVDTSDLNAVEDAFTERTKILFVETPTNPVLQITDLAAAADLAHSKGARLVVDNTFMSPCFQKPLSFGADAVMHSVTKYLNGHSDVVGGILLTSDEELHEQVRFLQNAAGAVPGPWDCWLVLRGTKTLHLRMRQHEENARQMVDAIATHPGVEKIYYPGLESHPGHEIARKQQTGFGGMISIDVGSLDRAQKFVEQLRIFTLAESLGGVESLVCHPASMTHAAVPEADRNRIGVTDGLVRLSVGVEEADDLLADVTGALDMLT